jgi:hypothetical protein
LDSDLLETVFAIRCVGPDSTLPRPQTRESEPMPTDGDLPALMRKLTEAAIDAELRELHW